MLSGSRGAQERPTPRPISSPRCRDCGGGRSGLAARSDLRVRQHLGRGLAVPELGAAPHRALEPEGLQVDQAQRALQYRDYQSFYSEVSALRPVSPSSIGRKSSSQEKFRSNSENSRELS